MINKLKNNILQKLDRNFLVALGNYESLKHRKSLARELKTELSRLKNLEDRSPGLENYIERKIQNKKLTILEKFKLLYLHTKLGLLNLMFKSLLKEFNSKKFVELSSTKYKGSNGKTQKISQYALIDNLKINRLSSKFNFPPSKVHSGLKNIEYLDLMKVSKK